MSTSEELHEHAEHAAHSGEPFNKRVAATMAIIAAGLAVVGVLGQMGVTEELLMQQKASDQWAYYQAKSIRRYESEVARDVFQALDKREPSETYQKNADKYRDDQAEIQKKAGEIEAESRAFGAARAALPLRRSVSRNRDRPRFARDSFTPRGDVLACGCFGAGRFGYRPQRPPSTLIKTVSEPPGLRIP